SVEWRVPGCARQAHSPRQEAQRYPRSRGCVRMKPVVMKFGGTSVEDATAILRTAKIVAGRQARGQRPVVVVSAMAKVTDQLLAAAKAAGRGDRNGALAISARLRHRHCDTTALLLPEQRRGPLQSWIQHEFEALDEILRGLAAVGELTART